MLDAGEDGNLELLTQGPMPSRLAPVYKKAMYYSTDPSTSSTSSGTCLGLNPQGWLYNLSS
jgi:hypothetical protein